jgi:hypothetical protein
MRQHAVANALCLQIRSQASSQTREQRGAALLMLLIVALLAASAAILGGLSSIARTLEREAQTTEVLAQAKVALIGKAAAERHSDVLGLLPLPDLGSSRNPTPNAPTEGGASGNFSGNLKNLSVIGRLPWRALGLPPLRDAHGECLWYAVAGAGKVSPSPDVFNWDTVGHFEVFSTQGSSAGTTSTTVGNVHNRPLAIVFSAGPPLAEQNRNASATDIVNECGGNYDVRNYLDSFTSNANINGIVNYFSGTPNNATGLATSLDAPKSMIAGEVEILVGGKPQRIANDRLLTITTKEIFDRVKRRSDFAAEIDTLLYDLGSCLNRLPQAALPAPSPAAKGINSVLSHVIAAGNKCVPYVSSSSAQRAILDNWHDNLLYATMAAPDLANTARTISVNEFSECKGILVFSGERSGTQTRARPAEKDDKANYLEALRDLFPNLSYNTIPAATVFPGTPPYTFSASLASNDLARCIKGLPPTSVHRSFAVDFASFQATGTAVSTAGDSLTPTVTIAQGSGPSGPGGCFWLPQRIPLAGRTLRAYYEFQFSQADGYALKHTGSDRGHGITLQMVRGDQSAPDTCGTAANMGALDASDSAGQKSVIVETDIAWDSGNSDPSENHTAILLNGVLRHGSSSSLGTACNGSTNVCRHSPANHFEEGDAQDNNPPPTAHNQRIEIHTGCDSSCGNCRPLNHAPPNTYARISAWVDCTNCNDLALDLYRAAKMPTIQQCANLDTALDSLYFGLTGGFTALQGVVIKNLALRSD